MGLDGSLAEDVPQHEAPLPLKRTLDASLDIYASNTKRVPTAEWTTLLPNSSRARS